MISGVGSVAIAMWDMINGVGSVAIAMWGMISGEIKALQNATIE